MGFTIAFADNKQFSAIAVNGRNSMISSISDLIKNSNREIFEIIFDGNIIAEEDIRYYYLNPNNASTIIITDDSGNQYTHLDYVIPVKFSKEYVNDKIRITLILAQLTEVDKTLRNLSGDKNYVGTELEVAIAKKIDEISTACNVAIEAGVDYNDEHYSLTSQDQTNILAWGNRASNGMYVPYHADGQHCRPYSPDEFTGLVETAIGHIAQHTTYCNLLMRWIETLTDITEIEAVVYGETALTGTYLEEYMTNMELLVSGKVENEEENIETDIDTENENIINNDNNDISNTETETTDTILEMDNINEQY